MKNRDVTALIRAAKAAVGKREITADVSIGRVACAILSASGKTYVGLNVRAAGDLGFCAEVSALSQMLLDDETEVSHLAGVNDAGTIIPPCGRCRELMYQINRKNLKAQVIMSETTSLTLEELLPHRWQDAWGER